MRSGRIHLVAMLCVVLIGCKGGNGSEDDAEIDSPADTALDESTDTPIETSDDPVDDPIVDPTTEPVEDPVSDPSMDPTIDEDDDAGLDAEADASTACPPVTHGGAEIRTPSGTAVLRGVTDVVGSILIDCATCTDLSDLACLTTVTGDFDIRRSGFTSLSGLDSLERVDGNLSLIANDSLGDLYGLETLVSWRVLEISDNDSLTVLDGFPPLTTIAHEVRIVDNAALSDLTALSGLTTMTQALSIEGAAITDMTGLGSLTSATDLLIQANPSLTSLTGLGSLTSVMSLYVLHNASLTSLAGLSSLTTVTWELWVYGNPVLASLDGLDAVTSVESLSIEWNHSLTNVDGLGALIRVNDLAIGDDVHGMFEGNDALTSLNLTSLVTVSGMFKVGYNDTLPDCVICTVLGGLTTGPTTTNVTGNLADSCSPVPSGCP